MEPYAAAAEGGGGADAGAGLEGTRAGPTSLARSLAQLGFSAAPVGSGVSPLPRSLGFWISDAAAARPADATPAVLTVVLRLSSVPFACLFAESMRRLGLDGEPGEAKLPERPGEADCAYYLRTGACGYGERCRYNHPRDRAAPVNGVGRTAGTVEYPERPGQPLCEYYAKNGTCKFGSNCKFDHPREGGFAPVALNSSGFPLRLGEKECSYYMKTGHCKFGATCKFHHPELGFISETPNMYQPVQPSPMSSPHPYPHLANWQMGRPPVVPGSFLPGSYPPMMLPPTVMPMQGWNPYISPMNQVTPAGGQQAVQSGPPYGLSHQGGTSAVNYGSHYAQLYSSAGNSSSNVPEYAFPERPGQPECEHYMKTGTCKYGAACKYNHPQYFSGQKPNCALSPLGLPLRPVSRFHTSTYFHSGNFYVVSMKDKSRLICISLPVCILLPDITIYLGSDIQFAL
ncbi:hypothetical protein U9M48_020309 [Paspalum notatum var. saurae]|uniref:C3H1-type domain-containing protein n=1 Tax=Paspalum notatum var. saurae TaxID=547442 RepID=A0AAQ3TFU5_PASNO